MFRDNDVYVNSGNNGRTYQAYFYDPSNGLGSLINSGVITSTSFSTILETVLTILYFTLINIL